MLTGCELRRVLHYDETTGVFRWKERLAKRTKIGEITGSKNGKGYLSIQVFGKPYLAHRLAFLYVTDKWPPLEVDHINGIRHDNRFANLRHATSSQNGSNTGPYRSNKSGAKGVSWNPTAGKWEAGISFNKKRLYLGVFDTVDEAANVYQFAATLIYGEFARF